MSVELDKIRAFWDSNTNSNKATETDLKKFQSETGLIIPNDLAEYFKKLNGTKNYDRRTMPISANRLKNISHAS